MEMGDALYAHKDLKTLELTVTAELQNLYNWLTSNKLSLNIKMEWDFFKNLRIFWGRPKKSFKRSLKKMLLDILETEDSYIDVDTIIVKMKK